MRFNWLVLGFLIWVELRFDFYIKLVYVWEKNNLTINFFLPLVYLHYFIKKFTTSGIIILKFVRKYNIYKRVNKCMHTHHQRT